MSRFGFSEHVFPSKYRFLYLALLLLGGILLVFPNDMAKLEQQVKAKNTKLIIGVQGGRGSFNELAVQIKMSETPQQKYEIKYLHTAENVLSTLDRGEIDSGQFAIRNTLGGEVAESTEAMKKHKFVKIAEFNIKVVHNLMISPNATISDIDTVVAHPQAFRQCTKNLAKKFPKLLQQSGEGDLIDPSTWAEKLGRGEIGKNYAILGNKALAKLNNLKIVEENMQDSNDNYTTFVWVKRPQI